MKTLLRSALILAAFTINVYAEEIISQRESELNDLYPEITDSFMVTVHTHTLELAALKETSTSKTKIAAQANSGGAYVGVSREFSTWSDVSSVFRPSRWKDPFRPGGPLSFLNLECWFQYPGRTAKTFIGTGVVIGGIIAIIPSDGGGSSSGETDTTTPTSGSGGGSSGGGGGETPPADPDPDGGGFVEETTP